MRRVITGRTTEFLWARSSKLSNFFVVSYYMAQNFNTSLKRIVAHEYHLREMRMWITAARES